MTRIVIVIIIEKVFFSPSDMGLYCGTDYSIVLSKTLAYTLQSVNQSINQSWIYIAHKRKASNALMQPWIWDYYW